MKVQHALNTDNERNDHFYHTKFEKLVYSTIFFFRTVRKMPKMSHMFSNKSDSPFFTEKHSLPPEETQSFLGKG
jgi:hypothetical protein